MFATLESAVGTVSFALCALVLAAAAVKLIGVALAARGLQQRVETMPSAELLAKLRRAPADLERIQRVGATLRAQLGRAAIALASIAASLASLRAQGRAVARVFRIFG